MNMTRSAPELAPYRRGDLAKIPCAEPDPIHGWAEHAEANAHDLRSIHIGTDLVACFGYMLKARDEAEAFAVVDREACMGSGKQITLIIRERQLQWMRDIMCVKAWAYCARSDKAAMAFLRAIGYQRTEMVDAETATFILELRDKT